MVDLKTVKNDEEVKALFKVMSMQIEALGFTEHSNRHSSIVSNWTGDILSALGAEERVVELGMIAGYLHDIGNAVNRHSHAQTGALLAYNILTNLKITITGNIKEGEIVSSGGIDLKEINPKTMESKLVKGLYFAGEVLDVDALTGGFNLQCAFSTFFT